MTGRSDDPLARLLDELTRLPGIGRKSAARLAQYVLRTPERAVRELAEALIAVKESLFPCSSCYAITAVDPCSLCSDPRRDRTRLCVVEEPFDLLPIERTGEFRGLYHVLNGVLSPQRGVGPDQLTIPRLLQRLDGVQEVIVATNPNVEGEATAHYLGRLLGGRELSVSRLAFGLPVGSDLEYVDDVTLARSLAGRRPLT